jgi:hypothetical protein
MLDEAVQYVKFLHMQIKVCVQSSVFPFFRWMRMFWKERIQRILSLDHQCPHFLPVDVQLLSSDEMWMYAPLAYDSVNIGIPLHSWSVQEWQCPLKLWNCLCYSEICSILAFTFCCQINITCC